MALVRKELVVLFGSPVAYVTLTLVALVTALLFFDHLRVYNQILFLYTSTVMGGFESGTVPGHFNLQDQVFVPLMEQLGLTLVGVIPLVTMRVFSEEKERGTEELLMTTLLTPHQIVVGKFVATYLFVSLMLAVSFIYPVTSVVYAGLGEQHIAAVFLGLLALGCGLSSIGLACSAFSTNQLVAAISAYAVAFVFYDFAWAGSFVNETVASFLDAISINPRFRPFAEGLVALEDVVYFAGMAAIAYALARLSLEWVRVR